MMKKRERIIILILLIISLLMFIFVNTNKNKNTNVIVKDSSNNIILTFDLNEDNYYELTGKYGKFNIEVKEGKCRAINVDCPNQICVHTGWISAGNPLPIVCLPNGIVVQIDE